MFNGIKEYRWHEFVHRLSIWPDCICRFSIGKRRPIGGSKLRGISVYTFTAGIITLLLTICSAQKALPLPMYSPRCPIDTNANAADMMYASLFTGINALVSPLSTLSLVSGDSDTPLSTSMGRGGRVFIFISAMVCSNAAIRANISAELGSPDLRGWQATTAWDSAPMPTFGGRCGAGRATGTFSHRQRWETPLDTHSPHGWFLSHFCEKVG